MIPEQRHDTTLNLESMAPLQGKPAPSLFSSHQLQPREGVPVGHTQEFPDWIFGILIAGAILVAWTYTFYFKRFTILLSASFSKRYLSQLTREGNLLKERIAVSLSAVYILSFGMVLYVISQTWFTTQDFFLNGWSLFLVLCLFLLLYWALKFILLRILGVVFRTQQSTHDYLVNSLIFTTLTGLSVLPLLPAVIYLRSEALLIACIVIIVLLFIIRFIKGVGVGLQLRRFSYLFLFVYLCALELLPLLILLKLVLQYTA